jgi:hypothetical protein
MMSQARGMFRAWDQIIAVSLVQMTTQYAQIAKIPMVNTEHSAVVPGQMAVTAAATYTHNTERPSPPVQCSLPHRIITR